MLRFAIRTLVITSAILLTASSRPLAAQARPVGAPPTAPGEIHGRLVESASQHPLGAGSITVVNATTSKFAGGALPNPDGSFKVDGLLPGTYTLRVRALGYSPVERTGMVITAAKPVLDLGTIGLAQVATQLGTQVVSAEREDAQLAPDRNVYSTKNMATTKGGTAIDVLRNVPSVDVDATNNVSLRGNQNVVVQINGRSTPLKGDQLGQFLQQLPATAVKNVEVSTNPSAKNDPEGTAGIINIVLDQDTELGLSGGLNLGGMSSGQASASGNIGQQRGPLTLFVSYGLFGGRQNIGGTSEQTNLVIPTPAFVDSRIDGRNKPLAQNVMFRSEYRLRPNDALSADIMASGGHFQNSNASYFSDLDASGNVIGLFDQFSDADMHNQYNDFDFAYRHTGTAKVRTYSTELDVTNAHTRGQTNLFGVLHQGDASTGAMSIPNELDQMRTGLPQWSWQADLTQPWSTGTKLEAGLKEVVRHTTSDFSAAYLDSASDQYVNAPARATSFDYREQIAAGYAVLTQQVGKVQAQGGLRLEQATTKLGLPLAPADSQHFSNDYASAFPSGILAYNFSATRQAKISYSRRITRPYPQQLSPVEFRQDARTLFRGNPSLKPEYTDALELGFQDSHKWGTLQINPYLRHTSHAVRFIQTTDTTGITLGTFENVASTLEMGTDVNVSYHAGPVMLFGGATAYRYSSDAANLSGNLSTHAIVWSARANVTYKITKTLNAQAFDNYRSAYATEGGRQNAFTMLNVAIQKQLWGNKGSVTL
ncbi:MAG TPA: TonB-dependent receptor, partial [Gemmatimonadaceae bacterium]|nr:TonB-dependent receptor [Gemmatimonadaceae bacterium]